MFLDYNLLNLGFLWIIFEFHEHKQVRQDLTLLWLHKIKWNNWCFEKHMLEKIRILYSTIFAGTGQFDEWIIDHGVITHLLCAINKKVKMPAYRTVGVGSALTTNAVNWFQVGINRPIVKGSRSKDPSFFLHLTQASNYVNFSWWDGENECWSQRKTKWIDIF